jgi:hypothetical protein
MEADVTCTRRYIILVVQRFALGSARRELLALLQQLENERNEVRKVGKGAIGFKYLLKRIHVFYGQARKVTASSVEA